MTELRKEKVREAVREAYGRLAQADACGCGCAPSSCCDTGQSTTVEDIAVGLGYTRDDVTDIDLALEHFKKTDEWKRGTTF